ncbi:hypothetical protein D1007_36280 [Hordeum vulgare]|nr:hypothetical protein D1007_36280 [Hordeum vulgare]
MMVAQYCRCLQQLANAMANVGESVSDYSLTLQLVCGLSTRFHVMATLLPMHQPFPTFVQARSRLLLEEIGITEREDDVGASALTIAQAGGSSSDGSPSTDREPPSLPQDKGKSPIDGDRHHGGHDHGRGRGRDSPGASSSSTPGCVNNGQQPWLRNFAPWGPPAPMPQQWRSPWVPANSDGVLGPRPAAPDQAYPVAAGPPPSASTSGRQ